MTTKKKVKNVTQMLKGRVKSKLGHLTQDPTLEHEGQVEESRAHLHEAAEEVKDALNE
ncbi:MAG TPA: CsbD family protein [Acidimicrobiales bacterium]|nr:CsbD family protein [Acidimicrobiales bacterium]